MIKSTSVKRDRPHSGQRYKRKRRDRNSRREKDDVSRLPRNNGKAPLSDRDKKTEEKQLVVAPDNRPKWSIINYCQPFVEGEIKRLMPHLAIGFNPENPTHPHQITAFIRRVGNKMAYDKLSKYATIDNPIVDVGLSTRNAGRALVHGVECGRDPYTHAKMIRVDEKFMNRKNKVHKYLSTDTSVSRSQMFRNLRCKPSWTYCRCPAAECNHILMFCAAMLVHSLYYFTPENLGKFLYFKTLHKIAVSIHHLFPFNSGNIYRTSDAMHSFHEITYRKVGGGNVICNVANNDRTYKHSDLSWMYNKQKAIAFDVWEDKTVTEIVDADTYERMQLSGSLGDCKVELIEGGSDFSTADSTSEVFNIKENLYRLVYKRKLLTPLWLTWTTFTVDIAHGTVGATFRVIHRRALYPLDAKLRHVVTDVFTMHDERLSVVTIPHDERIKLSVPKNIFHNPGIVQPTGDPRLVTLIQKSQNFKLWTVGMSRFTDLISFRKNQISTLSYCDEPEHILVPLQFIVRGIRKQSNNPINAANRKVLFSFLKQHARPEDYAGLYIDDYMLTSSIGLVVNIVFDEVMRNERNNSGWHTPAKHVEILRYNRSIKFEAPFWWKYAIGAFLVTFTILLLLFTFSTWVPILAPILMTVCIMASSLLGVSFLLFYFGPKAISFLIPGVSCGVGQSIGLLPLIGCFVMIGLTIRYFVWYFRHSKYQQWERFKRSVEFENQTIDAVGSVPFGSYLSSSQTLLDLDDYPINPRASFKIKSDDDRVYEECVRPQPGCLCLAPIFNGYAPKVFNSSQHNSIASCRSRVVLNTPFVANKTFFLRCSRIADIILKGKNGLYRDGDNPSSRVKFFELDGIEYHLPHVYTWEEYRDRYPPQKRLALEAARSDYLEGNWNIKQLCYKLFVKRELEFSAVCRGVYSAVRPRAIQACSQLAKAISGIWFLCYSYALKFVLNPTTGAWYCSGYTTEVFNSWFSYHLKRLGGLSNVLFLYADFSKYDVTQGETCIRDENRFYKWLGIGKLVGGLAVLRSKLKTVGYGKGFKYTNPGMRKSGDNDTSSGNSRNTFMAFFSFLFMLGFVIFQHFAMAILGDDNMTIVNRSMVERIGKEKFVQLCTKHMSKLGYSVKVGLTNKPLSCEFLSLRWYQVGNEYKIGKKPGRCLAKLGWFVYSVPRKQIDWLPLVKATMISFLPTSNHVPFLRIYLKVILSHLVNVEACDLDTKDLFTKGKLYDPTFETYVQFHELYGLGKQEEDAFELLLTTGIKKYGLSCILFCPDVDHMVRIDADPFQNQ